MAPRRAILMLLVLGTATLDHSVHSLAPYHGRLTPSGSLLLALGFSQISLLAMWTALGTVHWLLRSAILVGGIGIWSYWMLPISRTYADSAILFAVQASAVVVGSSVLWFQGLRWVNVPTESAGHAQTASNRPWQFSLAHILVWTTIVAALSMAAKFAQLPLAAAWVLVPLGVANTIVALSSIWVLLPADQPWQARLTVHFLVAGGIGFAVSVLIGGERLPTTYVFAFQGLFVVAWLAAFRGAGYSITRTAPSV